MAANATPSAAVAPLPLTVLRPLTANLIINRLHMLLNGIAIAAIFSYRFATFSGIAEEKSDPPRLLPHLVVLVSETILTFLWILHQAARWRPVKRAVFPEQLPDDELQLPAVDVFVCTADPSKEPSLGVMNTVLSAMSLDYPSPKLSVYISDDGGSAVTLNAVRETWRFSRYWVPFCRKYEVEVRCPEAYFSDHGSFGTSDDDFLADRKIIQERYGEFKDALEKNSVNASKSVSRDHPPTIEVMTDENEGWSGLTSDEMPLLVYVAREKRPGHPHHFKGGAVNVLLRVSAVISNAPYFLVLDCDMYCNDPSSARQAMCFYLDPKVSSQIAWVQFPQQFHNATERDLYDGRLNPYLREGQGFDGLRGPTLYGCNFFMKREAIHGTKNIQIGGDLNELKELFGSSDEFIEAAIHKNCYKPKLSEDRKPSDALQKELQLLASSTYDTGTQWGKQIGFRYCTVVEDALTSLQLHCSGWVSVAIDDPDRRPCFLGTSTTNLSDMLVQQMRWSFGLMQIGLSRFTPLIYGPLRMSVLQSMCYGALVLNCLYTFPFYGLSIIPPICLLYGIPLYPNVSDPFFFVFAYVFLSSHLKHVQEVFAYGDYSLRNAMYEVRVWMMKSGTGYFYALVNSFLDKVGMHEANFNVTNKAGVDDEQAMLYERGIYDFRASPMLLVPLCSIYILNLACLVVGMLRIFLKGDEVLFAQAALSFYGVVVNYHLLEGMFLRKDSGRISGYVSQIAIIASGVIFGCGSLLVHY